LTASGPWGRVVLNSETPTTEGDEMGTGSYFDKALTESNMDLIENMRREMRGVKYDTIIGTGLSGTIFTARVAPGLRKKFAIVRKEDDTSTHSGKRVEGVVGERFVVADDFVSSGATLKRVLEEMKEKHPRAQFVGVYQYERGTFTPVSRAMDHFGSWVADVLQGGPILGPKTLQQAQDDALFGRVVLTCPEGGWSIQAAETLPLPASHNLELDYLKDGEPTFWDRERRYRIYAQDRRVQELVRLVRPMIIDGTYGRMIGEKMNRIMQVRRPKLRPVEVDSLRKFAEAITRADEAMKPWTQAEFPLGG
jgi:hypothetical protein